ncbi:MULTISPECIES: sigma-70 family RNA polymerase sigma factor [unclassified Saccharothrix]|uniref:sigma-70 family RNA polymerase sigma factor n=1 Tax=unclassified Saccharothrix TaxID=2593673 RepID=UPI00307D3267
MTDQVDTSAVVAARAGDRAVLGELLVEYLPLVYNIVRRALHSDGDVDDVVQETMVRVVRGIGGLREPERFRSWLVAITVNQIRDHRSRQQDLPWSDEHQEQPDPEAEFVDRALDGLALEQQRRDLESAGLWLTPADRDLLSLWSLQWGGHLTRAEIADVLRTNAHNVTVKMGRLRNRLDAARLLTRALSADPRCPGLTAVADQWPGEPNPLWRKRMLRHVDGCRDCRRAGADLVPVQRLLIGAALLAVPVGYAAKVLAGLHGSVATAQLGAAGHHAARPVGATRIAGVTVAKPVMVAAGVVLAAACGIGAALLAAPGSEERADAAPTTTREVPATSSIATTPPDPTTSPTTSIPVTTARTTTTTAAPTPTPEPTTTTPAPSAVTALALDPNSSRMLKRLNERRRELGLPEVQEGTDQVTAAYDCAAQNLRAGTFEHCGHEVLFTGGGHPKPEDLVDAWFESPGHRTALTYPSSRWAGAVIVNNTENNRYIAAINIDY